MTPKICSECGQPKNYAFFAYVVGFVFGAVFMLLGIAVSGFHFGCFSW